MPHFTCISQTCSPTATNMELSFPHLGEPQELADLGWNAEPCPRKTAYMITVFPLPNKSVIYLPFKMKTLSSSTTKRKLIWVLCMFCFFFFFETVSLNSLPSIRITGVYHHVWLLNLF